MTDTAAPTVKDQELESFGLVESSSVNSIPDFIPSKINNSHVTFEKGMDDFSNTFICHLIFYVLLIVTLFLYILIDLELGSFIKNKFVQLIGNEKNSLMNQSPLLAH